MNTSIKNKTYNLIHMKYKDTASRSHFSFQDYQNNPIMFRSSGDAYNFNCNCTTTRLINPFMHRTNITVLIVKTNRPENLFSL